MGILDKLVKAELKIRDRIDTMFGAGSAQTPLEVRRGILEQVESRIVVDRGGRTFPFERIVVALYPSDNAMRDIFRSAFGEGRSLEADVRELLGDARARFAPTLEVVVNVRRPEESGSGPGPLFAVEFVAEKSRKQKRPAVRLTVVKGAAEQTEYALVKERILIGRLAELLDPDGQVVRRNDVVFLDNGDEINSTVGRAHGAIHYNREKNEYRIIDDTSRFGTRIFREGRSIEVPGGNPRGVRLQPGDEIYLGRACIRFRFGD